MRKRILAGFAAVAVVTLVLSAPPRVPAKSDVPAVALRVAAAHGIAAWDRVVEISYTFNVESGTRK